MNERTPEEIARALINVWMFRNVEIFQNSIADIIQSERDRAKAELELVKKQRDEAVAAEASATSRFHHAKEVSKTVWATHEKQFAEVTAERDRLRAALEGLVGRIDTLEPNHVVIGPHKKLSTLKSELAPELQAAREALKWAK